MPTPVFHTSNSGPITHGGTTGTVAITVTAPCFALIGVAWSFNTSARSVTALTCSGGVTPARLIDSGNSIGNNARGDLWGAVLPGAGTYTFTVTLAANVYIDRDVILVVAYDTVDPVTPTGTPLAAVGDSTTPTKDVTSAAGELVIGFGVVHGGSQTVGMGAGQTQRLNVGSVDTAANGCKAVMSEEAGAGTVTSSFTCASDEWAVCTVSLKGAAAALSDPVGEDVGYLPLSGAPLNAVGFW